MTISFKNALGLHPQALAFRTERASVLAKNLVNADTPGFRARDVAFADVLADTRGVGPLRRTDARHFAIHEQAPSGELKYRTPLNPSEDNNTVDVDLEQAEFMRNAMAFQASFTFLNGKFRSLSSAIRGE